MIIGGKLAGLKSYSIKELFLVVMNGEGLGYASSVAIVACSHFTWHCSCIVLICAPIVVPCDRLLCS